MWKPTIRDVSESRLWLTDAHRLDRDAEGGSVSQHRVIKHFIVLLSARSDAIKS